MLRGPYSSVAYAVEEFDIAIVAVGILKLGGAATKRGRTWRRLLSLDRKSTQLREDQLASLPSPPSPTEDVRWAATTTEKRMDGDSALTRQCGEWWRRNASWVGPTRRGWIGGVDEPSSLQGPTRIRRATPQHRRRAHCTFVPDTRPASAASQRELNAQMRIMARWPVQPRTWGTGSTPEMPQPCQSRRYGLDVDVACDTASLNSEPSPHPTNASCSADVQLANQAQWHFV